MVHHTPVRYNNKVGHIILPSPIIGHGIIRTLRLSQPNGHSKRYTNKIMWRNVSVCVHWTAHLQSSWCDKTIEFNIGNQIGRQIQPMQVWHVTEYVAWCPLIRTQFRITHTHKRWIRERERGKQILSGRIYACINTSGEMSNLWVQIPKLKLIGINGAYRQLIVGQI